jgi:hypothetical protein
MKPIQDDVDELFQYYFRCNSTIANDSPFYVEDCIPAVDLSDKSYFITRREDATIQCPKNYTYGSGKVSKISNFTKLF